MYSSSSPADGLCAIDVNHTIGTATDITDAASNAEISLAAKIVLDSCVLIDERTALRRSGGMIRGLGECIMCVIHAFSPPQE